MRNKRTKRIISIFCMLMMVVTLWPNETGLAKAGGSSALQFLSCLDTPAEDTDCVSNTADVCNRVITVKKGTQFKIDGWVLSNKKINAYELIITTTNGTQVSAQKVTPFDWTFPAGLDRTITSGLYNRANSGWVISVNTDKLKAGNNYVLYIVARYDSKYTFNAAKIKIHFADNNEKSYATCNDSLSMFHNQDIDQANMLKYPDNFEVGKKDNKIPADGWAIHDHGIKSYSYRIYQVIYSADGHTSSLKLAVSGASGAIRAATGEAAIGDVGRALNIGVGEPTTNARYSGSIPIGNLKAGHYIAIVVGTTLLWEEFEVCKVQFTIVPKDHQCASTDFKWQYTHNQVKSDGTGEAVPVYRCVICNKPNYNEYLYPTTMQHFISNSGSNEYKAYNAGKGIIAYDWGGIKYNFGNSGKPNKTGKSTTLSGMSGDQTGNEWFITEFSSQYGDRQLVAVYRYPDQNIAKNIALLSIDAAMNDNIGYDQEKPGVETTGRYSYYRALEKAGWNPARIVDQCESDCSAGICANLIAARINIKYTLYTKNIGEALGKCGFNVYTGLGKDDLMPGDILFYQGPSGSHVATNVSLGKNVKKGNGSGQWHLDK